jgi:hypothetical protein
MLYSESNSRLKWAAVSVVVGIGGYLFPLTAPWHILFLVTACVPGFALCQNDLERRIWGVLCLIVLIAVLMGYLPSDLSTAILSASLLLMVSAIGLSAIVLLLNLSTLATVQEILAETIGSVGLEAAAPSIMVSFLILLVRVRLIPQVIGTSLLVISVVWSAGQFNFLSELIISLAAIPPCGFAILMLREEHLNKRKTLSLPILITLITCLVSWVMTPPRGFDEIYFLLPDGSDTYESKFFKNYQESLSFAGIEAKKVVRPEDIPQGSLLLLPWLTSPFSTAKRDPIAKKIGELARARRWTVIVAGEHTNFGGVAARIKLMAGQDLLRQDLTVPPGNTDDSGPLHVASIRAWPHESILNRGASVHVNSVYDKVLLAGDGWWAEPDIGEWLWVGDYVRNSGERAGRLALAASADINGARWITIGDNSFLINSQLYNDPRPLIHIIEMSTLWPAFTKDLLLALFVLAALYFSTYFKRCSCLPNVILGTFVLFSLSVISISNKPSLKWKDAFVGQSGFDERNFNVTLAENPKLVDMHRLLRRKHPISNLFELPIGNSIIFMHVEGNATIGNVNLSQCRRLGSLSTSAGPYLMDAQVCNIDGPAQILIGSVEGAAAIHIKNRERNTIVILDIAFLGQKAPKSNAKWLLKQIKN